MPLSAGVKAEDEVVVVAIEVLMEERGSDATQDCVVTIGGQGRAGIFLLSSTSSSLVLPLMDSKDRDIDIG